MMMQATAGRYVVRVRYFVEVAVGLMRGVKSDWDRRSCEDPRATGCFSLRRV